MKNPLTAYVVYVHPTLAEIDGKPALQFAAEVTRKGVKGLESFQMPCSTDKEAAKMFDDWTALIKKHGSLLLLSHDGFKKFK